MHVCRDGEFFQYRVTGLLLSTAAPRTLCSVETGSSRSAAVRGASSTAVVPGTRQLAETHRPRLLPLRVAIERSKAAAAAPLPYARRV